MDEGLRTYGVFSEILRMWLEVRFRNLADLPFRINFHGSNCFAHRSTWKPGKPVTDGTFLKILCGLRLEEKTENFPSIPQNGRVL